MAYTSNYTGAQIDQAVGAYLTGNVRTVVTVPLTLTDWKEASGYSGKYTVPISLSGAYFVGYYPDVFIIDEKTHSKIIPEVQYTIPPSNGETNVTIYSNSGAIYGTIVLSGTAEINKDT